MMSAKTGAKSAEIIIILQVINHNGGVFGLAVTVFKVRIAVIIFDFL